MSFSCICLFVCFVCVSFSHFSLPLGVGGWLRFVTVTLPGLFYNFFFFHKGLNVVGCEDSNFLEIRGITIYRIFAK